MCARSVPISLFYDTIMYTSHCVEDFAKAIPCSEALLMSLMRRSSVVMLAEHACVGTRAARCAQPVPHHTSKRERERERAPTKNVKKCTSTCRSHIKKIYIKQIALKKKSINMQQLQSAAHIKNRARASEELLFFLI